MGVEIERKFLVVNDDWKLRIQNELTSTMRQGYLNSQPERVVRVRVEKTASGESAMLTIKGKAKGISRGEWEYPIPVQEANELLKICQQSLIEKKRYRIYQENFVWEIDEFFGDNDGLIVAEIELPSESQAFQKPSWLGAEVSLDHRYANANLCQFPFSEW